jgi:hypothetical protein
LGDGEAAVAEIDTYGRASVAARVACFGGGRRSLTRGSLCGRSGKREKVQGDRGDAHRRRGLLAVGMARQRNSLAAAYVGARREAGEWKGQPQGLPGRFYRARKARGGDGRSDGHQWPWRTSGFDCHQGEALDLE